MSDEQQIADDLWWDLFSRVVAGLETVYRRPDAATVALAFYEGKLRLRFTRDRVGMEILSEGLPISPN